jgi:hypothetical protein
MTFSNDAGPALCGDRSEARKTVGAGERDKQIFSPTEILNQAVQHRGAHHVAR